MAKKHLCSYFQLKAKENNEEAQSLKVNSTLGLVKSSDHVNKELKATTSIQERGQNAMNISSNIKAGVGKYAMCYGTQAARKRFSSKYPQYELK